MNKKNKFRIDEEFEKSSMSESRKKVILTHVKEKLEKEKTLNLSIKEAMSSSVTGGTGDSYITPYALALMNSRQNNFVIGLLGSLPNLLATISQIFGSPAMEKYPRKKIIVVSVALNALMWLPIISLSFFFWKNLFTNYLPTILIILYSLYAVFGAIAGPAWFSLMGELVPEKIRGKYFSKRNKIAGGVVLVSMLIAAFVLDFFKTKGLALLGFSILFFIACFFRLISVALFTKHHYPKLKLEKGYYFSFVQFIKKAPYNNFGKFTIYVTLMHSAAAIAGPFFAVYMLKDLNFSYTIYMLTNVSATIFTLLFFPLVGKFSDKYGNRELLKFGSFLVPIIPIVWLFSPNPVYLILVPQLIAGIGWAAFNFAASNFIYDSVTPQRRGICVAYFNVVAGIGIFLGATVGGLLAQYLPITFMNKLLFIFLISGILRFLVFIGIGKIKEVRTVEKPKKFIFYFKEINPVNAINDLTRELKFKLLFKNTKYL